MNEIKAPAKRMIIDIDRELHARVKIVCAVRGISIKEYVTFAIEQIINRENLTVKEEQT